MSHTATVKVEIKDKTAFVKACTRLGVAFSLNDTVKLYDGTEVTGMTVRPGCVRLTAGASVFQYRASATTTLRDWSQRTENSITRTVIL